MEKMIFFDDAAAKVAAHLLTEMGAWEETPQGHDYWRQVHANLCQLIRDNQRKPPEPQYRTPTDDDAKSRPTVRVRNQPHEEWRDATLIFVDHSGESPNYFTTIKVMSNNETAWTWFRQCQIIDDGGPL